MLEPNSDRNRWALANTAIANGLVLLAIFLGAALITGAATIVYAGGFGVLTPICFIRCEYGDVSRVPLGKVCLSSLFAGAVLLELGSRRYVSARAPLRAFWLGLIALSLCLAIFSLLKGASIFNAALSIGFAIVVLGLPWLAAIFSASRLVQLSIAGPELAIVAIAFGILAATNLPTTYIRHEIDLAARRVANGPFCFHGYAVPKWPVNLRARELSIWKMLEQAGSGGLRYPYVDLITQNGIYTWSFKKWSFDRVDRPPSILMGPDSGAIEACAKLTGQPFDLARIRPKSP